VPVNSLGFADDGTTLWKRSSGRLLIGIAGGSVAQQMSVLGEETLRRRLSQNVKLRGVRIELVRLALSGFKQPQQLMALNYVLSLGGQLDVLVNIDGFNEIVLPSSENRNGRVFAAYPHSWDALTYDMVNPRRYAESYDLLALRARRQEAARAILASPFRFSPTRTLMWKLQDSYLERQIRALGNLLFLERKTQGWGFASSGPPQLYQNQDGMFQHLAEIWKNSSTQISLLCRGNGIRYIHILQPNQYVDGSKPMGYEERDVALSEIQRLGPSIRKGYPRLAQEGKKLVAAGVDFHDLSRLFANVSDPLYADAYCHFNKQGNDLLAGAVAEAIIAALDQPAR
jgi:hypothetical protein